MITLTFSKDELTTLQMLIHLAVQARGMEVARAAVVLSEKLQAGAIAAQSRLDGKEQIHDGSIRTQ